MTGIELPDGLREIGDLAFGYTPLSALRIPDTVVSIGRYAFKGCSRLTEITIPQSVESIGYKAFNNARYINESSTLTVKLKKGSSLSSNIPENKWGAKEVILID